MKENIINKLTDLGYTANQISQLIKLENDEIELDKIFDKDCLLYKIDISEYRRFRDLINLVSMDKLQKNKLFDFFRRGVNCFFPSIEKRSIEDIIFILNAIEKSSDKYINVSYLFDVKYCGKWLSLIWNDLLNNLDVSVYLDETIPDDKRELVRNGLHFGINLSELVKEFEFIKEDDISDLKKLRKYDFKDILRTVKNVHNALFICQQKDNGIDISSFVNEYMTLEVIAQICDYASKSIDLSFLKDFNITKSIEVDFLVELKELSFPVEYCKNMHSNCLNEIIFALKEGLSNEEVIEIFDKGYGRYLRDVIIDCYRFNQKHYIEFLNKNELNLIAKDYLSSFKKLLEYNYKNKKNIDIASFLVIKDKEFISNIFFETVTNSIINDDIDIDFAIKLKNNKFNSNQASFLIKVKKKGYNLDLFFDNRLSLSQMEAIKTCLELGLEVNKNKDYDLPEKTGEAKETKYQYKMIYSNSYGSYDYVGTYDTDDRTYVITYK